MTGALTLLFILAITLALVRIAGVALRLTGLPQHVARFQSISALTGTGFTTSEAEGTMHHPTRRRILTLLMFAGNLGVVSLASTVILTMTSAEGSSNFLLQLLAMLTAIVLIVVLASNKSMDVFMCAWVGRMLIRSGWIEDQPFELLYEHPDGHQLCEHIYSAQNKTDKLPHVVAVNGVPLAMGTVPELAEGDRLIIFAREKDQYKWAHFKSALTPREVV